MKTITNKNTSVDGSWDDVYVSQPSSYTYLF